MALKNGISKEEILRRREEGRSYIQSGIVDYREMMMDIPVEKKEEAGKTNVAADLSKNAADENKVVEIPLELITPSRMNTFKAYPDEIFAELKASIESNGLLMPIIVRPAECCETYDIDTEFEIIAGEHRYLAHKDLGLKTIRCAIYKVDDVTASLMIGQTNIQREASEIEVARNYRKTYDLMKKDWGGDHTSAEFKEKQSKVSATETLLNGNDRTLEVLAKRYGIGQTTMHRKIRLTYLTDDVLEKYLKGKLTQEQAVQISFADEEGQHFLMGECYSSTKKDWIDDDKAKAFGTKAREVNGKITPNMIREIMKSDDDEGDAGGKSRDRRYLVPTSLFPKNVKVKERPLYIAEALMYVKTHKIELNYKPEFERNVKTAEEYEV